MNTPVSIAGAALLLLAAAAPAGAASSSRAEREMTRQLNIQAAQSAQQSNERSIAVKDAAAQSPTGAPPAAAPTARVQTTAMAQPQTGGMAVPTALASITNPPTRISTAQVLDKNGTVVGAVQRIEVTPTGTPTSVAFTLSGKRARTVVLDAATVSYDPARNEITAQATGDQIRALAGE